MPVRNGEADASVSAFVDRACLGWYGIAIAYRCVCRSPLSSYVFIRNIQAKGKGACICVGVVRLLTTDI